MPTTYTFNKVWDDEDNKAGRRPEMLPIYIYRDGKQWRVVKLNATNQLGDDENVWTYIWNDEGAGGTFEVYESTTAGLKKAPSSAWLSKFEPNCITYGVVKTVYDASGNPIDVMWWYNLQETEYDETKHEWTYTNKYDEGYIPYSFEFTKSLTEPYNDLQYPKKWGDPRLMSTHDRGLNELLRGESVVIEYAVNGGGMSTLAGDEGITTTITDTRQLLGDQPATTEDVEIAYVRMVRPSIYEYTYDPATQYFERTDNSSEEHTVELWAMLEGGAWLKVATMTGDTVTAVSGIEGVTVSGRRVNLPAGVSQVKETVHTQHNGIGLNYYLGLRVKPSSNIISQIEGQLAESDYAMLRLYNEAECYTTDKNTEQLNWATMKDSVWAYLHGRKFRVAAYETKSFSFQENDPAHRRLKLLSTLTSVEQSNVIDRSDYDYAVESNLIPFVKGGTWYDLLPAGVTPDLDTITLSAGDKLLGAYTVENYKGSGRTLLVIEAEFAGHISYTNSKTFSNDSTFPDQGYKNVQTVSFISYYSWQEYEDHKNDTLINRTAFEADEDWIGNIADWSGEPDDPDYGNHKQSAAGVGDDGTTLTNLDPNRDDPSFIYAYASLNISEIDMSAEASLRKHVSASGTGLWSFGHNGEAVVYEGGGYTYRLTVRAGDEELMSNIVFYDVLEDYTPIETDADYGDKQWKGSLLSVDTSSLREVGVAPVVYYSTVVGLELTDGTSDLTDSSLWSSTPPADLGTVTAVAVDASKKANGEDFILDASLNLIVYIHMRAPYEETPNTIFSVWDPDSDPNDHTNNAHAYNRAYMNAMVHTDAGEEVKVVHHEYTKVGILTNDISVRKVWSDLNDNDRIRPESVTVHLYADGVDTGLFAVLNEANEWQYSFPHVRKYDDNGRAIVYTFVEDEVPGYMAECAPNGDVFTVTNIHIPEKVSVKVEKEWQDDLLEDGSYARPASITVRLYADGEYTGQSKTIRADADGNWSAEFKDMLRYNAGVEIEYTVEEEIIYDFKPPVYEEIEGGWRITNIYYPYGDLSVTKSIENATEGVKDQAFTYTLLLTDANGNDLQDFYAYTITDAAGETLASGQIRNGERFTLHADEKILIKDIPSRARYEIVEAEEKGWTLSASSNLTGSIVSGTEKEAAFTNSYATSGTATLVAHKTLTGHDLSRYQFRFQVARAEDPATPLKLASNAADGNVTFSNLTYTNADDGVTYTYYITEIVTDKPGYTYDTRVVTAKVTPHDNGDGTMSCTVEYYDAEGEALERPEFSNEYHADGSIVLRAWKVLDGRELQDGEFSFELLNESGESVGTATSTADGGIAFPALSYDETDVGKTYYFFTRELSGTDETVICTDAVYGYYVTVIDNNDGTLSFDQGFVDASERYLPCRDCGGSGHVACTVCGGSGKIEDEDCAECGGTGRTDEQCASCAGAGKLWNAAWEPEVITDLPVFTNTLKDGSLSVTKLTTAAPEDDDTEFTFKIVLTGDKIAQDGEWTYTLTQAGAGSGGVNPRAITRGRNIHYAPIMHRQIRRMGLDENGKFHATAEELQGTAYAVLTDDGELIFFRSDNTYNDTVYTDIEDVDGNTYSGRVFTGVEIGYVGGYGPGGWNNDEFRSLIKTVSMAQAVKPNDIRYWFGNCNNLAEVDLRLLDITLVRGNGTDGIFSGCSSLVSLDLSMWDTHNADLFQGTFSGCSSLVSLNLSNWNLSNASCMDDFCSGCTSLSDFNCSGWITTGQNHGIAGMFANCESLTELDFSCMYTTSPVWWNGSMFSGCRNLETLDISNLNTKGSWTNDANTFKDCVKLSSITLGEHFGFGESVLPDVPTTSPYSGYWTLVGNDEFCFKSEELAQNYDGSTMAGTWVWQRAGYTIRFVTPEGVGGSMVNLRGAPESDLTITNKFVRFDHRFTGFQVTAIDGTPVENGAIYASEDGSTVTIPANTYALDQVITLTPLFEQIDHTATMEDGTITITLHGGETATFDNVPAGTTYRVYEQTPDGWTLIAQENVSGVIKPTETAEAKFTNQFTPGVTTAQLYGTKTLDNQLVGKNDFAFALFEVVNDEEVYITTVRTLDGGLFQFPVISYSTADENALGLHTYHIREVETTSQGIEYDKHTETVTVDVTKDESGDLHAEVVYDEDGASFKNYRRPGILAVTKQTEGLLTKANADAEFELEITLSNANGMPIGDGETVYWYIREADGSVVGQNNGGVNPHAITRGRNSHYAPFLHRQIRRMGLDQNGIFHATPEELVGTGYAVLTDDGELIFFRSYNSYSNGNTYTDIQDIDGNTYSGRVFTDVESGSNGWSRYKSSIRTVRMAQAIKPTGSLEYWFGYDYVNLTSADLSKMDTSQVTSLNNIFRECVNLTNLNVSTWDTSRVWCFLSVFYHCTSLTELDLTRWNTSSVTEFQHTFDSVACTSLDLSTWDTRNATSMYALFWNCTNLTSVNLSSFVVDKNRSIWMNNMFSNCPNLSRVVLGEGFNFTTPGGSAILPEPPNDGIDSFGVWFWEEDPEVYFTAQELRDNYNASYAGTWVWKAEEAAYVIFDANGGYCSTQRFSTGNMEARVTMPDENVSYRPGYDLIGWSTEQNWTEDSDAPLYEPGQSYAGLLETGKRLVLYAQWEYTGMYRYTMRYYQQDAYNPSSYALVDTVVTRGLVDTEIDANPDPLKYEGFIYDYCYPESVLINSQETAEIQYYYRRTRYTVAFDGNGAEGGSVADQNMVGGISALLSGNAFYKKAYIFTGWNTEPDGSGTSYSDRQSVMNLALDGETVTLYAQWTGNTNSVEPTGGSFTVKIRSGQTLIVPDLPAGTVYTVREVNVGNGWTQTGSVNADGTIRTMATSEVTITNTYAAEVNVILQAHKTLAGDTLSAGKFEFVLMDEYGRVIDTERNATTDSAEETGDGDEGTQPNPWYQTAPVVFDELKFTAEGTYIYTIRERVRSGDEYIYDEAIYTVKVTVTDLGNGRLKADVEYFDADGSAMGNEPLFTNAMKPGTLVVSKNVKNATEKAADKAFTFTVELKDSAGNALTGSYPVEILEDYSRVGDVEEVTKYAHSSNVSDDGTRNSDYTNNAAEKTVVTIPGAESLKVTIRYGTEGCDFLYVFEGAYEGSVYNYMSGANYSYSGSPGGETAYYTAELTIPGDSVTFGFCSDVSVTYYYGYFATVEATVNTLVESGEVVDETTVTSGGTISLKGGQSFRITGLPHGASYRVTEAGAPGWELTDYVNASGSIRAGETSTARFENTYTTSGSITLQAKKIFLGGEIGLEMFSFQIMDSEGRVIRRAYADPSDGSVVFDPIDYDQGDDGQTFTYYVSEVAGSENDIGYDTHIAVVDVTVEDNGEGKMVATASYRAEEDADGVMEFTNRKYAELTISKEVTGSMGDKERGFDFTVRLWTEAEDGTETPYLLDEDTLIRQGLTATEDEGVYIFSLSDGDSVTLRLVCHTHYEIRENSEDYSASVRIDGGEATETTVAEGVLEEDTTVAYTNDRTMVIPTNSDEMPLATAIGMVTILPLLIVFLLRKKKQRREEA